MCWQCSPVVMPVSGICRMTFCAAEKKHILISFQNDIVPLSNPVPEDVGKADQLKDEGKYCPQTYFLPLWRQQL